MGNSERGQFAQSHCDNGFNLSETSTQIIKKHYRPYTVQLYTTIQYKTVGRRGFGKLSKSQATARSFSSAKRFCWQKALAIFSWRNSMASCEEHFFGRTTFLFVKISQTNSSESQKSSSEGQKKSGSFWIYACMLIFSCEQPCWMVLEMFGVLPQLTFQFSRPATENARQGLVFTSGRNTSFILEGWHNIR